MRPTHEKMDSSKLLQQQQKTVAITKGKILRSSHSTELIEHVLVVSNAYQHKLVCAM